jgi:hypothetical protein
MTSWDVRLEILRETLHANRRRMIASSDFLHVVQSNFCPASASDTHVVVMPVGSINL